MDGWEYRWGDSPIAPDGTFEWLSPDVEGWQPLPAVHDEISGRDGAQYIWMRMPLPEASWEFPTLYVPVVHLAFDVFIDTSHVFTYGNFFPGGNKYSHVSSHVVPLSTYSSGGYLTFRVYSAHPKVIGIPTLGDPVAVGSNQGILESVIRRSAENFLLGTAAIFIGLISLFVFLRRWRSRVTYALYLGLFSFTVGLFYVSFPPAFDLLFDSNKVPYYLRFGAFLIFPIWLYLFVQRIVLSRAIAALWIVHAIYALVAFVLDFADVVALPVMNMNANILLGLTIIVMVVTAIREVRTGNREARIFMAGVMFAGLSGLADILQGMGVIPYVHWISPWGQIIFIVFLVYLTDKRFTERTELLKRYAGELEDKKEELETYAETLEHRVAERTQDLGDKNRQLGRTLEELRDTQQQLVLREKMASLGNLVAGVAHEVNNPIGAINSAADGSRRCIEILKQNEGDREEGGTEPRVQKALRLLGESNEIVTTAGARVAQIVRSLRNFSRLDEAEFQKADLHEGIDSTLTLVQHKLKGRIEVERNYGDIPEIECYPNQLNQVFMNLLVNSAQAIEGKGRITIDTSQDNGSVVLRFSDTGKGIAPEYMDVLFDPGFTTKGAGVGTGLGLSISYNIVEKHAGTIEVKSEPGQGTTFTIRLPIEAKT